MSSSSDDGEKAYALAMKHSQSGNLEASLKWARKALSIDPTLTKAKILLTSLERGHMPGHAESTGTSSGVNGGANGSEGVKKRSTTASTSSSSANGTSAAPKQREYTKEQLQVVARVNEAGRKNDYYGVLMLSKSDDPDENAIKKGYRKLALQLHPDKNGAPGADEAFKVVSKAFTILSDADKKAIYDRYGGDPDARGGGRSAASAASPFGGSQAFRSYGNGMGGGVEIDPNDLFNMFFGGGMGNGFGGTTFSFGGPGVNVHHFGRQGFNAARQGRQGRRGAQTAESSPMLLQLLPILLLGLFSLLSYAPQLFGTAEPTFSWSPQGSYRLARTTPTHNVKYYVDQTDWHTHPWVAAIAKASAAGLNVDAAIQAEASRAETKLEGFERKVENSYKNVLYNDCERRREYQARRIQAAQGTLFGIGADREAEQRIRAETYDSCERLRDFGVNFGVTV
jgi:DnaJ family protein B protein 12